MARRLVIDPPGTAPLLPRSRFLSAPGGKGRWIYWVGSGNGKGGGLLSYTPTTTAPSPHRRVDVDIDMFLIL
ncbi:hypothetical protein E2562_027559 [Oryza meyeriana var. granulata]|uniref:Uncharacterized protein n=1 Tax=Oryza meyeriana var. granulata TaxID=110450 RepID=A0A6G1EZG4_9ORYZ|nr:hypothetical protein E2562_027559 [Oryza meyeriana var. granulata]